MALRAVDVVSACPAAEKVGGACEGTAAWRLTAWPACPRLPMLPAPQSYVHRLQQAAAAGDPAAGQLRLQLLRLAATFVVESCEGDVEEAMQQHLLQLAAAK